MALSREDKADVKGAMGKAIANKVSKVTKDNAWGKSPSEARKEVGYLKKNKLGMFSDADKKLVKENTPKSKALEKKMYVSPTGSKHRVGSQKHKYWESIKRRGEDNARAGVPND